MDDSEWPESPPESDPEPVRPTEPEPTSTAPDYSSSEQAAETDDRMEPGEISSESATETDDRMEPGEISSEGATETDDRMEPGEISSENTAETDDSMGPEETSSGNADETDDRIETDEISEEPLDDGVGVCAEDGEQCGGMGWTGPSCCGEGIECVEFSESLHKCVRDRRANKKRGD